MRAEGLAGGAGSPVGADAAVTSSAPPPLVNSGSHPPGPSHAGGVHGGMAGSHSGFEEASAPAAAAALPAAPLSGNADPATIEEAVQAELDGLLELARVAVASPPPSPSPSSRPRKRRRQTGAATAQAQGPSHAYLTLQTKLRAMFEELGDWKRSAPLAIKRKRAKGGRFNTVRLRALQRFILTVGRGGMSLADLEKLYDFLTVWDGTQPGQLKDVGHDQKLRDVFSTFGAFKAAVRDDIDAAVHHKGWRKCSLAEGGQHYQTFFTPALHVILDWVRGDQNVRLWSGASGPAPPSALQETPLDGDAFRLSEKAVMDEYGPGSCVLGIHFFSDCFQLSWSGGK